MNKSIIFGALLSSTLVYVPAYGATYDTGIGDMQAAWVSNLTAGLGLRAKNPSCSLTGDPTAYGCGSAANTALWANGDDGNLNYKKGQLYTAYTSFTSELLLTMPTEGYKFLIRGTGMMDFAAASTQRTPLAADVRSQAVQSMQLLDFWGQKEFNLGAQRSHLRLGNQVVNWGESYFSSGGINATNSVDIQKLLIPGTQLKQALLPAPMLSFASSLPAGWSTEAYYQLQWNGNKYPPVGTFWSASDVFGRGAGVASFNSQNFNVASLDAGTLAGANSHNSRLLNGVSQDLLNGVYAGPPSNATGVAFTTLLPGNKPQFGLRFGYKPEGADVNFAFYYENYTDKAPVLSSLADGSAQWSYLKNRTLLGASANFALKDWAIGTELSYRPRDAVAMSSCFLQGGAADANTNVLSGATCPGWKDMKKIQFDINAQLNMTQNTHPFLRTIGADLGVFTAELTTITYPGVNRTRQYASSVNGQNVYQLVDAAYGSWLSNSAALGYPIATGQGSSTAVGVTLDFNWTYDGTLIPGWQVTPGITFYDAVKGYTPTFSANYEAGAKSLNAYILLNQNPQVWQAGINFIAFYGGNSISQPYSDRNSIGAFVTRNF